MYKKLLSNLPFNPSLIGQVSFYAARVHQEERLRRMGIMFVALSLFLQLFAVIIQPEPSLARSNNDIVDGGFSTKTEAINHCNNNTYNFRDTLEHFGVNCDALNKASKKSIRSTDYDKKLLSLGRLPYGKEGERKVSIKGKTYYQRYLWSWDTYAYSTYDALVGTRADGSPFIILYNCGNITVVEAPAPKPEPEPEPEEPEPSFTPGEAVCTGLSATAITRRNYRFTAQAAGTDFVVRSYTFGFGDGAEKVINTGLLRASAEHTYTDTGTYTATVEIRVNVQGSDGVLQQTLRCQTNVTIAETPTTTVTPEPEPEPEPEPKDVCENIPGLQTDESQCLPCDDAASADDVTVCVVLQKSANNITQGVTEANGTTARAGDVITYTLSAENTGTLTIEDFVVEEHIADMLEYAVVEDFHDGQIDENSIVRWNPQAIEPDQTITEEITIRIKDVIPETPVSSSNPGSYDLTLTNVYGNTVEIKLPASPAKSTEQIVQTLPNTGPGESLVISLVATIFVGFFFARTKLYAKELDIVRHDFATTGGSL
jgi:uncharacterized repeat protein (TIGR01451 family)